MTGSCDGAVAVVTGATGGIGAACARALRAAGARVTLVGRSEAALARLAREIGAETAPPCDLRRPESVREVFDGLPAPDVLIGCCGGNRPAPFLEMRDEDLAWAWETNVVAALAPAQAAARLGGGRAATSPVGAGEHVHTGELRLLVPLPLSCW